MKKQNSRTYHSYDLGSILDQASKLGMKNLTPDQISTLGGLSSAATGILPAIAGGNTSLAGNIIGGVGDIAMAFNPLIGAAVKGVGTLTNAAFGSNINEANVQAAQNQIDAIQQGIAGASSYDQLAAQLSNTVDVQGLDLGTQGWFSHAVDNKREALQNQLDDAQALAAVTSNNINRALGRQLMSNAFAAGGDIHIKSKNRGKFTAAAKARGMGVQEFASKVLANKEDYSPLMVKRANFAKNSSHWNAFGGSLDNTFTNGVTIVGNGGTHSENPNDGVQMGIAPDGRPNLVEEGEVIYNDYVFSNRLKVPKAVRQKYKLRGETFADVFKQAQKESEERPNDPISKNSLDNIAMVLATAQEDTRGNEGSNEFACGGKKYADGSELLYANPFNPQPFPTHYFTGNRALDAALAVGATSTPQSTYTLPATTNTATPVNETPKSTNASNRNLSWLRMAEPAANVAAVINDITGLTNKPYTYDFISPYTPIQAQTLGDYVQPELFDRNYWTNQALANQAATRRAVTNTARPSTAANLLAADYAAGLQLGQLARQGQEYNREQSLRTAEFNRATNQFNAQSLMEAAAQNARNQLAYDQAALQQARMNVDETNASWGAKAQNLGALATSIANIGRERDAYRQLNALIDSGVFGSMNEVMDALRGMKSKKKGE